MSPRLLLERIDGAVTRWLTAPERNAAGRMGLFRILFALFYLWYLATNPIEEMSGYRLLDFNHVLIVEVLPTLSLEVLRIVQAALVGALVLLAFGYHTRVATAAVLVLGIVLEAVNASTDLEHANMLLTAFVPLLMLIAGHWGDTYSLDGLRMRNRGGGISPNDPSGKYFLGARAVFVVLALLFTSAAISKVLPSSTWFTHPDLLANLTLEKNVENVIDGLPAAPGAGSFAKAEILHESMRGVIVLLEISFLFALFSATLRQLVIALALVFHSMNAFFLGIHFAPVLVAYMPFVDWQGLLERALPQRSPPRIPRRGAALAPLALVAAGAAAALWYWNDFLERVITLDWVLDWRTINYLVLPLALAWLGAQLLAILKRVRQGGSGQLDLGTPA